MFTQKKPTSAAQTTTVPRRRSLNSASGSDERTLLTETAELLNAQAQKLAASLEARLGVDINATSSDSQDNTKMMLDWVSDIYSIAADIQSYLNPEE